MIDILLINLPLFYSQKENLIKFYGRMTHKANTDKKNEEKGIRFRISRNRARNWTIEQDQKLIQLVKKYGQRWSLISKKMGDKRGKSCRERWINKLNPKLNWKKMNLYEEWLLFLGIKILGPKWAEISHFYPDRSDNQLKNHCHTRAMFTKTSQFKAVLREIIFKNSLEKIVSLVMGQNFKNEDDIQNSDDNFQNQHDS